jgi:DNA repair protein RadA/Sms
MMRLKEASRLGFKKAVISRRSPKDEYPMETVRVSSLNEVLGFFLKG